MVARWAVWLLLLAGCAPPPPLVPGAVVRRGRTNASWPALVEAVRSARLVCVGEDHDDPVHHRVQHALLKAMADDDRPLALGMEMFRRSHQLALDDFARGAVDAATLERETRWQSEWGFDFAMYAPLLHTCHALGVRILGLNAPKSVTRAVARRGLEGLPEPVRGSLPELDLGDQEHRAFFWEVMGFEGTGARQERFYAAQVIWDETMAEGAAAWLKGTDDGRVLVLAGNGHCHRTAIVKRVARRLPGLATVSVALQREGSDPLPHATSDYVIHTEAPKQRRPQD